MRELEKLIGINLLQLLCFFQVQFLLHYTVILFKPSFFLKKKLWFGLTAEGTTTNGDYLLTFKTGAFLAGTPVLPVILKYPYERFSAAWDTISGVSISFNKLAVGSEGLVLKVKSPFLVYPGTSRSLPSLSICKPLGGDTVTCVLPFTRRER